MRLYNIGHSFPPRLMMDNKMKTRQLKAGFSVVKAAFYRITSARLAGSAS